MGHLRMCGIIIYTIARCPWQWVMTVKKDYHMCMLCTMAALKHKFRRVKMPITPFPPSTNATSFYRRIIM